MAEYVALLRGIGPANPNMRNEKLRAVFEQLGFTNVRTVISSGNVLFETNARSVQALEEAIAFLALLTTQSHTAEDKAFVHRLQSLLLRNRGHKQSTQMKTGRSRL